MRQTSSGLDLTSLYDISHTAFVMTKKPAVIQRRVAKRMKLEAHVPFSSREIKSAKLVADTLIECIRSGDLDSFRDVLTAHLLVANKLQLAKKAGLGRRTIYDILDRSRNFNPELSTVSALIRALAS